MAGPVIISILQRRKLRLGQVNHLAIRRPRAVNSMFLITYEAGTVNTPIFQMRKMRIMVQGQ